MEQAVRGLGSLDIVVSHAARQQTRAPILDISTEDFVKSLAKQLGPKGIRVNGVAPGPIWTPLRVSGGATQNKLEKFGGNTALRRHGQPSRIHVAA